ncbi:hypothetical protein Patl1_24182 [Pistacia atlantica]|uniref:Uncharacterized protein n=1 Tax=Pistacia atlantica TaxID=434234 RepID=A0ACC0ZZ47_9ROSI|nr:hypothetical protein Patl1_24182 [Pistacia atlantica]
MAAVKRIKLDSQGLEVSAQSLGCMGMSFFYGPPKPEPEMITLIHHAINSCVTFLDTSDVYGPHTNEILLGKALKGGMRERVELATKFGARFEDDKLEIHGDPAYVRADCEGSFVSIYTIYIALTLMSLLKSRELGIGIVAYSPLGKGFLSSGPKLLENISKDDCREVCKQQFDS